MLNRGGYIEAPRLFLGGLGVSALGSGGRRVSRLEAEGRKGLEVAETGLLLKNG